MYGKFLWAPLLDLPPSFTGLPRRKGWAIITQIILILCMLGLTLLSPTEHIKEIAGIALVIAFASASQDAVLDAHRREILTDEEMGLGSSIFVNAYRLSSLIPGSLALYLLTFILGISDIGVSLEHLFASLDLHFGCPNPVNHSKLVQD